MISDLKRWAASVPVARRFILPVFSRVNLGDITVKHAVTHDPVRLHSFRHRGFWYHGKSREGATIDLWKKWVQPGQQVIEVGGHIGYLTVLLSRLTGGGDGNEGRVVVFEPGPNNLPYLIRNTANLQNVELQPFAVGDHVGEVAFYIENLTGQNNSLSSDYEGFASNLASAHSSAKYTQILVQMTTLDAYCKNSEITPDWMKIDVEGHELGVLHGATEIVNQALPAVTIEITRDHKEVGDWFFERGYVLFSPVSGEATAGIPRSGDYFALHQDRHKHINLRK